MGTYVFYERGGSDGLRSRFLADVGDFARWLCALDEEYPGEFTPRFLAKLEDLSVRGADALKASDHDDAYLIDCIVHEYWSFCDITDRHGDKDITPSAHKLYRYAQELSDVLPTASDELCRYYKRLFAGNSLAECDGHSYRSVDGVFYWSWLLPHEVEDFHDKLQNYAGFLESDDDWPAGVRWVLEALGRAKATGSSLLVSIA